MSAYWSQVKKVAADALERPRAERESFAYSACRDAPDVLVEVLGLIASFDTADSLLSDAGPPAAELREALDHAAAAPGRRIGKYLIIRPLGSGAMGSVFEARDESLRRQVALKLIHAPAANPAVRRRFETESTVLAMLRHPAIAQIYDAGVDASGLLPVAFLAMELVPSARTIDRFVLEQRPSRHALVAMLADIADAVHHGHQRGVIHRDLKPHNILVDPDARPKVIDFGVARLISPDADATLTFQAAGTPAYMSPEQLSANAPLDVRSDVYSLAIVARELLSGQPAFPAAARRTPSSSGHHSFIPPAPLPASVGPELSAILDQASAADPDSRYRSASEFAADLRRVLADEPILARPPSRLHRARLFARRNRLAVAASALVALALLLGLVGLSSGLLQARAAEARALQQARRATRSAEFLRSLLRAADPSDTVASAPDADPAKLAQALGQTRSVSDLLGFAADRVEAQFADDPDLRADIAILLADAASAWTDYRYRDILAIAHRCATAAYGDLDPRTLRVARLHAQAVGLVDAVAAIPLSLAAFEHARAAFGLPDPRTLDIAVIHHDHLLRSGAADQAAAFLQTCRAQIASLPEPHELTLFALDLADVPSGVSPAESLTRLRRLRDRARQIAGPQSGAYYAALAALIGELKGSGEDPQELLALAREIVALSAASPNHGSQIDSLGSLAFAHMAVRDLPAAEAAARQTLKVCTTFMSPESIYTPKAKGLLARILLERGQDIPEAEHLAREASQKSDLYWSLNDGWSIYHLAVWADAVRALGDPRAARDIILSRRAACPRNFLTDGTWDIMFQATVMANCQMDLHDLPAAAAEIQIAKGARARHNAPGWPSNRLVDAAETRLKALQLQP